MPIFDTTGTLPTTEEVTSYLADKIKQAKQADRCFVSSAGMSITKQWADPVPDFLEATWPQRLGVPSVPRSADDENLPGISWLRSAGLGQQPPIGAANYYVMRKDISDLTETTAITFLGTSITCARCHNHPLDKWTDRILVDGEPAVTGGSTRLEREPMK